MNSVLVALSVVETFFRDEIEKKNLICQQHNSCRKDYKSFASKLFRVLLAKALKRRPV